jgi:hypothetical protein
MPSWLGRQVKVQSAIENSSQIMRSESQKVDDSACELQNTYMITSVVIDKRAI